MARAKQRRQLRAERFRGWLLLDKSRPLRYEKEAIYEGEFGKLDASGEGIEFEARRSALQHWKQSISELRANGVSIPLAKSHDKWDKSEEKLGELVGGTIRKNKKGIPSLFLVFDFEDEKSRDIALKGDISIGSPPVWYDGKKQKYIYPLQHIASTSAPVIPGLETWQAIAAAFEKSQKGTIMELDELIALLGIEVDESVSTDDGKKALVIAKLKELAGGGTAPADDKPPADVDMAHDDDDPLKPKAPAAPGGTSGAQQPKKVTVAFAHPVIVETVRDARMAQLDALVQQRIITPATKKELVLSFCTDEGIKLELSQDDADGKAFENAIKLVKLVAKDRPLSRSGRSEFEDDDDATITLSHQQANNGLVKSAERRAKEAASQR